MMGELMRLMRRACRWLIRNRRSELNVVTNMQGFTKGLAQIGDNLSEYLTGSPKEAWQKMYDELIEQGVPDKLASRVAGASHLYSALGIIEAQEATGVALKEVAKVFYELGDRLDLSWFVQQLNILTPGSHWQALARETFREDLDWQQRSLTVGVIRMKNAPSDVNQRLDMWMEYHKELVDRWKMMLTELKASKSAEYAMYSVALRELLDLAQSTEHAFKTA
jgi:glutamate dehydrogenase